MDETQISLFANFDSANMARYERVWKSTSQSSPNSSNNGQTQSPSSNKLMGGKLVLSFLYSYIFKICSQETSHSHYLLGVNICNENFERKKKKEKATTTKEIFFQFQKKKK